MLTYYLPKLKEGRVVQGICAFLYSPWYFLTVALLMAMSNIFALEFPVFYIYVVFCALTVLLAEDCFPVVPMICCGYMLFSLRNNPVASYGETLFSKPANVVQFIIIIALLAVLLVSRFVFELRTKHKKAAPSLWIGYLLLGLSYIFAGLFSPGYDLRTVLFGLVQIICISVTYFFVYFTVDWQDRKSIDYAYLFTAIGLFLVPEVANMYRNPDVLNAIENKVFQRGMLITGWGINNNVGVVMAIFIPAPFYLATQKKHGEWFSLLGVLFMAAVLITQSRNSMLVGVLITLACMVLSLRYSEKKSRRNLFIIYTVLFSVAIAILVGFFKSDRVYTIIKTLMDSGLSDSGRFNIYKLGWRQFLDYPVFGNGFYAGVGKVVQFGADGIPSDYFLPPRYHNTWIQLLATGGAAAMLCYLYHRYQTLRLYTAHRSPHRIFIGMSVLVIAAASILDNHFFNMGPGLLYGVLLAMTEGSLIRDGVLPRTTKKKAKT